MLAFIKTHKTSVIVVCCVTGMSLGLTYYFFFKSKQTLLPPEKEKTVLDHLDHKNELKKDKEIDENNISGDEEENEESIHFEEGESILRSDKSSFEQILKYEFKVDIPTFFKLIYSDESKFNEKFHTTMNHQNFQLENWRIAQKFGKIRKFSFILPLSGFIGPKQTRINAIQRYILTKDRLVVEESFQCPDVPYGDYFVVEKRDEFVSKDSSSSTLVSNIAIRFEKSTYFESKIRSGTISGSKNDLLKWAQMVDEELKLHYKPIKSKNISEVEEEHPKNILRQRRKVTNKPQQILSNPSDLQNEQVPVIESVPANNLIASVQDLFMKYLPFLFALVLLYLIMKVNMISEQISLIACVKK